MPYKWLVGAGGWAHVHPWEQDSIADRPCCSQLALRETRNLKAYSPAHGISRAWQFFRNAEFLRQILEAHAGCPKPGTPGVGSYNKPSRRLKRTKELCGAMGQALARMWRCCRWKGRWNPRQNCPKGLELWRDDPGRLSGGELGNRRRGAAEGSSSTQKHLLWRMPKLHYFLKRKINTLLTCREISKSPQIVVHYIGLSNRVTVLWLSGFL